MLTGGEWEVQPEINRDEREAEEGLVAEIDEAARPGRYVVIVSGDGPFCRLADGWYAMLETVAKSLWDGDDPPDDVMELVDEIDVSNNWSWDDDRPFHFTTAHGDLTLTIYRIQD